MPVYRAGRQTGALVTTRPVDDDSPAALVDCLGELARAHGAVGPSAGRRRRRRTGGDAFGQAHALATEHGVVSALRRLAEAQSSGS